MAVRRGSGSITKGNSHAVNGKADIITDWAGSSDYIISTIAATESNYEQGTVNNLNSIEEARNLVEFEEIEGLVHVFLANNTTDTGYLVSDLDGNGTFETGVIINGAGSLGDLFLTSIRLGSIVDL